MALRLDRRCHAPGRLVVRCAARRPPLATSARGLSPRDLLRRLRHIGAWQRRTAPRVPALPVANERLDDFQSGARLAPGTLAIEIGRQLFVRAKDFLIAHLLVGGVLAIDAGFASLSHRYNSNISLLQRPAAAR